MGQQKTAEPAKTGETAPKFSNLQDRQQRALAFYGRFSLREDDGTTGAGGNTVATSLGGIKQGILLIDGERMVLKQRLTVAGGFLWVIACLLPIFLMMLLPDRSAAAENIKAMVALTLLGAALVGPIVWSILARRLKREYNLKDVKSGVVHGEELELRVRPGTDSPSAPAAQLTFRLYPAGQSTALIEQLTKSGVRIEPGNQQEIKEFQESLMNATPKAWATLTLMAVNIAMFAVVLCGDTGGSSAILLKLGADFGPLTVNCQQWWRILACCFLHLGVLHLVLNLYALFQAGWLTERLFGNWFFLLIYLGCGLAGSLTSLAFHPDHLSVGASGAIFGVYGALLGYFARQSGGFSRRLAAPVLTSAGVFVVWNLVNGLLDMMNHYAATLTNPQNTHPAIDQAAHLGGLVSGLIFGFLGARPLAIPERRAVTRRCCGALAIGICAVAGLLLIPAIKANPLDVSRMRALVGLYYNGEGVTKDREKAAYWMEQAAATGDRESELALGAMYYDGDGVDKDPGRAAPWFEKAAEQGDVQAEKFLMTIYFAGQGVPTNALEGVRWLTKIADQNADQDCNEIEKLVGLAYFNGDGLPKNESEGVRWLSRVAARGDKEAKAALIKAKAAQAISVAPEPGDLWLIRYVTVESREKGQIVMDGLRKKMSFDDSAATVNAKASPLRWHKAGELPDTVEKVLLRTKAGICVLVDTGTQCFVVELFKKVGDGQ